MYEVKLALVQQTGRDSHLFTPGAVNCLQTERSCRQKTDNFMGMVSTRGVKLKFFEGEKVLCYEPDPTKAKVLYESKVKDVVINKDSRGRKSVEYLIHFRGWNSSWDRCVSEEFILKDTVENRQLQKDLAQKSKLQFGSYLYRKERKKHSRKLSERVAPSSEDGSCGSPAMEEEEDRPTSSSEEDSSVEEETVPLDITDELREMLEADYEFIHEKNKLHRLPAEPNVITILESYWKHYRNNLKSGVPEKNNSRFRNHCNNGVKMKPELIQKNINLCQEVLDGIRIYFDFCLPDLLLYNGERGQVDTMPPHLLPPSQIKMDMVQNEVQNEQEYISLPSVEEEDCYQQNDGESTPATRRRTLRSYRSVDTNSNGSIHSDNSSTKPSSSNNCYIDTIAPFLKIPIWKALPDYIYSQQPLPPSLQYGATHLVRLFVKLPELLVATNMAEEKLKVLLGHLENFIDFLNEHKEWYGEICYTEPMMT